VFVHKIFCIDLYFKLFLDNSCTYLFIVGVVAFVIKRVSNILEESFNEEEELFG